MKTKYTLIGLALLTSIFSSCSEDETFKAEEPIGAVINVDMGGSEQDHQVYINLNDSVSTRVADETWNLALYNGSEFVAKLNYATGALAKSTGTSDWSALTDAIVEEAKMFNLEPATGFTMAEHIDSELAQITETVIPEISSTDANNEIFVIKQAEEWFLVQVLQANGEYKILSASTTDYASPKEQMISKDAAYNFSYLSFVNGKVSVEPMKDAWDILFSTSSVKLAFGPTTSVVYGYKDYVFTNTNVEVALIKTGTDTEEGELDIDFATLDIATYDAELTNLEFSSSKTAIGSTWRSAGMDGVSLNENQFYILKFDDKIVKLRFTALTNGNGDRGYQQFEYAELK